MMIIDMSERGYDDSRKMFLEEKLREAKKRAQEDGEEVKVLSILYGSDLENARKFGFEPCHQQLLTGGAYLVKFAIR